VGDIVEGGFVVSSTPVVPSSTVLETKHVRAAAIPGDGPSVWCNLDESLVGCLPKCAVAVFIVRLVAIVKFGRVHVLDII
jgi:hypothetical protein